MYFWAVKVRETQKKTTKVSACACLSGQAKQKIKNEGERVTFAIWNVL